MFDLMILLFFVFFFSSRRRHTRCALVTGVQTCALPIFSADGLKAYTPPAIVKRLRIFGDNDPKYGGQAAAYALAHRMSVRLDCVECSVEIPNQTGTDWADRRDT